MPSFLRQLQPLKVNPVTKEVYLQLPPPHQNIIITPPRASDVPIITVYLNDPRVHKTLQGPPYPYLLEHAEWWLKRTKDESDKLLATLHEAASENGGGEDTKPILMDGCPVRALREVREDGSDLFVGDIGISRCAQFSYLRDEKKMAELIKHNESLAVGHPEIIWDVGDYLAASHHGKGIMTAALRMIMHDWAIPRMNAKRIIGITFTGNVGSVKVFEKNGFEMFDTVEDCVNILESKGGGKVGLHFLDWRIEKASI